MSIEPEYLRRARERARQCVGRCSCAGPGSPDPALCAGRESPDPALADAYPEDQRGDAWEPPVVNGNGEHGSPKCDARPIEKGVRASHFPDPIPTSQLTGFDHSKVWIWHGCTARQSITLFSALCKAGKSTLLAHLLRVMGCGGLFCGLEAAPCKVLYISEESEGQWAQRRERLDLRDHVFFVIRPFTVKPTFAEWLRFLAYVHAWSQEHLADLVVFDTLANLWPVRDENDASQVQAALMPLHRISNQGTGVLLVHHLRKGDGAEATAARGSGALAAFVDIILELRRFNAKDRQDRKRVLTGYSRFDETPNELVVELAEDGVDYTAHGSRLEASREDRAGVLAELLPDTLPGWTEKEILEAWPNEPPIARRTLLKDLAHGHQKGLWKRTGTGRKNDPYRYAKA